MQQKMQKMQTELQFILALTVSGVLAGGPQQLAGQASRRCRRNVRLLVRAKREIDDGSASVSGMVGRVVRYQRPMLRDRYTMHNSRASAY